MTVRELIRKSMLLIGAISTSENLSADEASDGLESLNDMIESWSTEGLLIYQTTIENFNLVAAQADYTIGSAANFATVNPQMISQASIVINSVEYPLNIIQGTQEWAQIVAKTVSSQIPSDLYFKRGAPTSTISLYPVPSTTDQIRLYSKKPLTAFATVSETISLPQGYKRALRYNLALELAVEYGRPIDPRVDMTANDLKTKLKRSNIDPSFIRSDLIGVTSDSMGTYDIYKGSSQ